MSIFSPVSVRVRPGVTALAVLLLGAGLGLPQLLPRLFNATVLRPIGWAVVLGLPVVARLLLWPYGLFVRGMQRARGLR